MEQGKTDAPRHGEIRFFKKYKDSLLLSMPQK
jgi:hypothetical protein